MDDDRVTFHWKDYAANSAQKMMALDGTEFIRRFLMHVLPDGFMRIRHYGFWAMQLTPVAPRYSVSV